ncbi:class II aldolase/adducin family protein [Oceanispirochaeta sp.]|jgi:L-fuculose-phosphate aldolase|uniref:class II aldolase/adducin family protein n=1 Tax=Oceanispirochaeta sp. TaxID=2035350 RepID=UPI00261C564E|nr:class II aldolase/adducin family protein [Oceanispirochaeta sp.]MDA3958165.1 class II aldolase/adducin family protein [Oceanispirochaeta sp.]
MRFKKQREAVASTMRRLYSQGLTTCSGGNISFRVDDHHVLITPAALDKGIINFRQIALMTLEGENLTPGLKPSIETGMHLKILRSRKDICTVVHAHPLNASLITAADTPFIRTDLLAEARYLLMEPVFAPYALMGTEGLGDSVSNALSEGAVAALLENHGVLTIGNSLLQAFDRLEVLEAAAEMTIKIKGAVNVTPLNDQRLTGIDGMHAG